MKLFFYYIFMIALTVVANLLLKTGVAMPSAPDGIFSKLLNVRVFLGLASFGFAALFYMLILTKFPLNVAQSFATVQFVAVILASSFVLGEPIGALRWIGICMISVGILLVGRSAT